MSTSRDPLYDDKWTLQELFEDYAYALSPTMCIAVRDFLDGKRWHGRQQPQRSYLRKAMERLREYARRDHMVVPDNISYHLAHGGGWPERRLCYYSEQFRRASARSVRARPMRAFQETGESKERDELVDRMALFAASKARVMENHRENIDALAKEDK